MRHTRSGPLTSVGCKVRRAVVLSPADAFLCSKRFEGFHRVSSFRSISCRCHFSSMRNFTMEGSRKGLSGVQDPNLSRDA